MTGSDKFFEVSVSTACLAHLFLHECLLRSLAALFSPVFWDSIDAEHAWSVFTAHGKRVD